MNVMQIPAGVAVGLSALYLAALVTDSAIQKQLPTPSRPVSGSQSHSR